MFRNMLIPSPSKHTDEGIFNNNILLFYFIIFIMSDEEISTFRIMSQIKFSIKTVELIIKILCQFILKRIINVFIFTIVKLIISYI